MEKGDLRRIQGELSKLDEAREKILKVSRQAVRLSSNAIIQIHRSELGRARKTLRRAEKALSKLKALLEENSGFKLLASPSLTAFQEYAEAKLLFSFVSSGRIASLKEVNVDSSHYLLGLLDFVGELRRLTLNLLRGGETSKAEAALRAMEEIYESLYSLDHTSLIPNFRHKMDGARRILEATRSDLIAELRKASLEEAIRDLEKRIRKVGAR